MARITFKKESGIESISGKVGNVVFRTINGQTYLHASTPAWKIEEPKNASERRERKRHEVIDNVVRIIQSEMDIAEAAEKYKKIYNRAVYIYAHKLSKKERSGGKKQQILRMLSIFREMSRI